MRGGDAPGGEEPTAQNCCIAGLLLKNKVVESLEHVILHCPAYEQCRLRGKAGSLLEDWGMEVTLVRRARWGWRGVKTIRALFSDIVKKRESDLGVKTRKKKLDELAESLWY